MGLVKNILYQLSNKKFVSFFDKQTIYPYYHLVSDEIVPHIDNLYRFKNKNQFIKDIDFLIANYQALNPIDLLLNKKSKNKFLITFDDGLQEIYSVIYPILKERNISAIFFINPNFVDNNDGLYKHYSSIIINDLKKNNFQENVLDKISEICEFSYSNISDFESKLIKIKYSERHKIKLVLKLLNFNINEYLRIQKPYITKSQIHEMINDGFYFGGHTMSHPPLQLLSLKNKNQKLSILLIG